MWICVCTYTVTHSYCRDHVCEVRLCPVNIPMGMLTWACECAHLSMCAVTGFHRALLDPEPFCPHRASLGMRVPAHVCTGMGACGCAPGWVVRYILSSKDELRPMESPPSPAPLCPILPFHCRQVTPSAPSMSVTSHFSRFLPQLLPAPYCSPYTSGLYPALPLPATPLHSASDSLPVSSTVSSNTILPPDIHFRKPRPSYCLLPPFTPPPHPSLLFASELRMRFSPSLTRQTFQKNPTRRM